ncbi:MAG: ADP-glyceromanno-heptose 6-epimerase [Proteobacteria bacterium]|nr:MAG: ADP-glyceromanno-heptose 6-epimerase [Pseudomonadota bacterium]
MKLIVVTGGAGFIGANIIDGLNRRGEADILLVDDLTRTEKIRNISDLAVADYMDKQEFRHAIREGVMGGEVRAIFHQGACSDTMAADGRYVMDNNYAYSRDLYRFCVNEGAQFIYASSASVYGSSRKFKEHPDNEKPLNAYAYSKFQFDNHLRRVGFSKGVQVVGLRYFNVYGYREQHKHRMASVAYHFFNQFRENGKVRLFTGSGGYDDGEQRRDFVFVEDVVDVNLYFYDNPSVSGIFNVGTGRSGSFNDVARAVVNTLRAEAGESPMTIDELVAAGFIDYIPMPEALQGKYQNFTEADLDSLREAGCGVDFRDVDEGVGRYVGWLLQNA